MIIDCQLKSFLKNYLKNIIVGFGKAGVLSLSLEKSRPKKKDVGRISPPKNQCLCGSLEFSWSTKR